jgi:hypothetical protein
MDNKIRKYKFEFQIITTDTYLVDQNVTSYKFINKGDNTATLNNQMVLQLKSGFFYDSYEEMIYTNEKTAQGYKIVFGKQNGIKDNLLQVIKKIEVFE